MKVNRYSLSLLAAALTLAAAGAGAQTSARSAAAAKSDAAAAKSNAEAAKELAEARAELARASKRYAELAQNSAEGQMRRAQIESMRARRPVVGVILAPDESRGVRIAGVTPDSAAAKAGLVSGDRIVTINGAQVLGNTGELRMQNARKLLGKLDDKSAAKLGYQRAGRDGVVSVTPQVDRVFTFVFDEDGKNGTMKNVKIDTDQIHRIVSDVKVQIPDIDYHYDFDFEGMDFDPPPGISPEIRQELRQISEMRPFAPCKGKNCKAPMLLSAFRWNGLNLAEVDPQLGRYFGTDRGVLVLSTGDLDGLQAGDVIQKIDGRNVDSPREAMDVLRDKPADASASVSYLRDRRAATTQIKVPRLRAFPTPPAPPAPPKPPAAPRAPAPMKAPAPPAAPRAPAPPPAARLAPPMPPAPPAPPTPLLYAADGRTVSFVYVNEDGTSATWSTSGEEPIGDGTVESNTR